MIWDLIEDICLLGVGLAVPATLIVWIEFLASKLS